MERLVWWGYSNRGSVNVAEAMAYVWPAMWLANRLDEKVKEGGRRKAVQVHVITDSEYVRSTGDKEDRMLSKNGPLWEAFDAVRRQGVVLNWHWRKRATTGLNLYTDQLSKMARTCFREYNLQQRMATNGGEEVVKTVYEVNPG
jgi:ribonuclease HI